MKFFEKIARTSAFGRKQEQYLYAMVLDEVQNKKKLAGLWSMALAKSGGDTNRAESLYISLRVQDIKDDAVLLEGIADTLSDETSLPSTQRGTTEMEDLASGGELGSESSVKPNPPIVDAAAPANTQRAEASSSNRSWDMDQKIIELNDLSNTLRAHLR